MALLVLASLLSRRIATFDNPVWVLCMWLNVQSEEKSSATALDPASGVVTGETMQAVELRCHWPAAGGDRERTCVVILPCGSGFIKNRAFSTGLGLFPSDMPHQTPLKDLFGSGHGLILISMTPIHWNIQSDKLTECQRRIC